MKWTKFKDKLPQNPTIYITNFCSVWVSYSAFADWTEYSNNNPEYSWAEIPLPEAPTEAVHHCESQEFECTYYHDRGTLILRCKTSKSRVFVDFCPFYGYSIDENKSITQKEKN